VLELSRGRSFPEELTESLENNPSCAIPSASNRRSSRSHFSKLSESSEGFVLRGATGVLGATLKVAAPLKESLN
jgi:hypothetical protein